jgi:hypothetical protein
MADGADRRAGTSQPTQDEIARLKEERDRLEAEVGDLRGQVATAPRRAGRPRRVLAGVLVVVTAIVNRPGFGGGSDP